MRNSFCFLVLVLILSLILVGFAAKAQEPDPIVTWQMLVNQARLDEGLAPYGLSSLLSASAQRHAGDMATNQASSHIGSDGSMPKQRIREAGYAAWTQDDGELIVGENFWIGRSTIEDALAFFLNDPPQRENVLSPIYREIGIGVATDADGRDYYVLDFGVRPNVLPIFINDGAASTDAPQVAIRLTNEDVRPEGQGANFMGLAIEIRISNEPSFDNLPWQPWEPLIPWTLADTPGEHAVYIQFRDAAGRTAAAVDTIVLGEGAVAAPTSVPPSPTSEPTAIPVPPSAVPEPTITAIPEPAATPMSVVTSVPEPPPATESPPAPQISTAVPSPLTITPFPTWTPLPTPTPQQDDTPSPLPPWLASLVRLALPSLVALQGIAIILGIYLILRRGR